MVVFVGVAVVEVAMLFFVFAHRNDHIGLPTVQ
jgi:hypothetical protein